jgi:predicted O-methyltransferase YrrM
MKILNGKRESVLNLLKGDQNIGVELGVAKGIFSLRMLRSNKFLNIVGVDAYEDHHNVKEYGETIRAIGLFNPKYHLLRMRFQEAISLFEDGSLDFVYVDGYAHEAEGGGETIYRWFKKIRVGGVMAGDDYDNDYWPMVYDLVNSFSKMVKEELYVTDTVEEENYCRFPSWAMVKTQDVEYEIDEKLFTETLKKALSMKRKDI